MSEITSTTKKEKQALRTTLNKNEIFQLKCVENF